VARTGQRVTLASLADDPPSTDSVPPRVATQVQTSAPIEQIAANPLNTREIDPGSEAIAEIAASIRAHGQLQACAVVTRAAFLSMFPEYEAAIGGAVFVQVTGGRRRVALPLAGKSTMDIKVHDHLAESRLLFLSATAAENIDREDYNAIEEARAVELLVRESKDYQTAADKLGRTKPWITQRINLLKLAPEIQEKIKANKVALRDVRSLHQHPAGKQMAVLERLLAAKALTAVNGGPGESEAGQGKKVPGPRTSATGAVAAVRQLGGALADIAASLRAVLGKESEGDRDGILAEVRASLSLEDVEVLSQLLAGEPADH
jgi:ParB family chromosome partitioning protein